MNARPPHTLADAVHQVVDQVRASVAAGVLPPEPGSRTVVSTTRGSVRVEWGRVSRRLRVVAVEVRGWAPSTHELRAADLMWCRGALGDQGDPVLEPVGLPGWHALGER